MSNRGDHLIRRAPPAWRLQVDCALPLENRVKAHKSGRQRTVAYAVIGSSSIAFDVPTATALLPGASSRIMPVSAFLGPISMNVSQLASTNDATHDAQRTGERNCISMPCGMASPPWCVRAVGY